MRKQYLITGGKTILGFVKKKGGKFGKCEGKCAKDITASSNCKVGILLLLTIPSKAVTGLSSVTLRNSAKSGGRKLGGQNRLKGLPCEWIDLGRVQKDGLGCVNGTKFVVQTDKGVSEALLAYLPSHLRCGSSTFSWRAGVSWHS